MSDATVADGIAAKGTVDHGGAGGLDRQPRAAVVPLLIVGAEACEILVGAKVGAVGRAVGLGVGEVDERSALSQVVANVAVLYGWPGRRVAPELWGYRRGACCRRRGAGGTGATAVANPVAAEGTVERCGAIDGVPGPLEHPAPVVLLVVRGAA